MITRLVLRNFRSHEYTDLEFRKGVNLLIGIVGSVMYLFGVILLYSQYGTLNMNKMAIHRVDTIVIAVIFINFILRELGIEDLWQCSFALKEGSIYQIINNQL